MASVNLKSESVVLPAVLERELQELVRLNEPSSPETRTKLLKLLKEFRRNGLYEAEQNLLKSGKGTQCAQELSQLTDAIIKQLYEFVSNYIYPRANPTLSENISIIAVGGYGRGGLAPYSDIDLLFLLPYKQTPWGEQVIEYMLYILWDLGLKVGYAVRNINEAVRYSIDDMTIRTSVLEARFICGDIELFDELQQRFDQEVIADTALEFIHAKLHERDLRHQKSGQTRYLVEPNVKESKGGQRDLHTLFWITKYYYRIKNIDDLVKAGVLSRAEARSLKKAEDFLCAVRAHMHFICGKAEERLSFDIQRDIAERLGYKPHPGQNYVERFMKHYFLVTKDVGDLTRIICAALEEQQAKYVRSYDRVFTNTKPHRRKIRNEDGFITENHRLNIARDTIFDENPVNILRLFYLADKHGLSLHPHAMQKVSRSLKLINADLRDSPEANALFLDILTSPRKPSMILRRMNESGVLGKFIPDFGKIVAMMQFNMYHHYTVDEHLLRCIQVLSELEHGDLSQAHPLSHQLLQSLKQERRVLYVAVLLHDIAKGRPEDHSIAGARIARRLCPRFGLSPVETDLVAWLVQEHMVMSKTAQSRDLTDRKTIQDFAEKVQTTLRLKLLLILTVCDISGVGPDVWNGWKGQLLRTLYIETELLLRGGFSEQSQSERKAQAQAVLADHLTGWIADDIRKYSELFYTNYFLSVSLEDQLDHVELIRRADKAGTPIAVSAKPHDFEAVTELTILAPDHPRLLTIITGACAAAQANIVDAQIFTTRDGRALDTILISREFDLDEDEKRRAERVGDLITDVLTGKRNLADIAKSRPKSRRSLKAFRIQPRVEVHNDLSNKFTVIEIKGLDRPGLLSELTAVISDLALDIASAHITTFGEKVIDTFYVTDLTGEKVQNATKQNNIKRKLLALFDDNNHNKLITPITKANGH